jgi:apolipoprotein N-acyltransferase
MSELRAESAEPATTAVPVDEAVTAPAGFASLRERPWPRRALSLLAGLLIAVAMPPFGWWPAAMVGIALWGWLIDRPRWTQRFWIGVIVGIAWFEPTTLWMVKFSVIGWPIGIAVWFGLVGGVTAAICPAGRWRYLALAGALILSEWLRWHAPFGGVPLSMLAMTQGRGPLLPVARVAGSMGVSAGVAVLGCALGALLDRRWRFATIAAVAVIAVAVIGVYAPKGHVTRSIEAAAVQGGGPQETRSADTDYAIVFGRHMDASDRITAPVDLVVWPENVVNVPVFKGSPEESQLSALAQRLHATVVAGVVEDAGPNHFLNAAVAIGPDGTQIDRYDKVRRVPYGEYVPLRFLLQPIVGAELPPRDQIPGHDPNILTTPAGRLGTVISWEVFFPRRVRAAMHHDADLVINPTNGSSYWLDEVQTQQLASSSLRAVESGRWLVQAAPTGFSAIVDPSGDIVARSNIGEATVLRHRVDLRQGSTVATILGDFPALVVAFGALGFAWAVSWRRRRATVRDESVRS